MFVYTLAHVFSPFHPQAEVDTIEEGNECGIGLVDYESFQPDDVIECYVEKKK